MRADGFAMAKAAVPTGSGGGPSATAGGLDLSAIGLYVVTLMPERGEAGFVDPVAADTTKGWIGFKAEATGGRLLAGYDSTYWGGFQAQANGVFASLRNANNDGFTIGIGPQIGGGETAFFELSLPSGQTDMPVAIYDFDGNYLFTITPSGNDDGLAIVEVGSDATTPLGVVTKQQLDAVAPGGVMFHEMSSSTVNLNASGGVQSDSAYGAAQLSAAIPGPGNLHVTITSTFRLTFVASPPDATRYLSFKLIPEVDFNSDGFNVDEFTEHVVPFANGVLNRKMSISFVVAYAGATISVIRPECFYQADVENANVNVASVAINNHHIDAYFVPGTPISDGGIFTP